MSEPVRKGWWRRNWWALLAVLPALAAIALVDPDSGVDAWRATRPGPAVTAGADGWVSYAGTRARLVSVDPADLRLGDGGPFPLPSGLAAWQATVSLERTGRTEEPEGGLPGCQFQLEDDAGRLFSDDPSEAAEAYLGGEGYFPRICSPPEADPGAEVFDVVALFVLPATASPVALRLTVFDAQPAYARFPLD